MLFNAVRKEYGNVHAEIETCSNVLKSSMFRE